MSPVLSKDETKFELSTLIIIIKCIKIFKIELPVYKITEDANYSTPTNTKKSDIIKIYNNDHVEI